MSLAAVVVHHGPREPTARTVRVLLSCPSVRWIVLVCHSDYPAVSDPSRWICLREQNRGYAAGINLAARYLLQHDPEVDRILAMNPDVNLTRSQVEALECAHAESAADCTFPAIREGKLLIQGYEFTSWGTMQPASGPARFYPGTCFLFSLGAWEKAGGLEESYFHYYEDLDFCLRLSRAGLRIHHAPEIVIDHAGKSGADYPSTPLPRYAVRNHLRFLRLLGPVGPLTIANVALRHFLYLFRWRGGLRGVPAWARGVREYLAAEKR